MSSPFEPTWYVTVTALRNNVLTGEARRGSSWNCASAYTSVHSEVRVLHLSVRRARLRYVSNRPDPPPSLCSSAPPPSRSSSPFPKVERLSHKFSGAAAFFVSLPPAAAGLAYRTNARPANESRRDGGNGNGRRRRRTTSLDGIGGRGEDASILCGGPKIKSESICIRGSAVFGTETEATLDTTQTRKASFLATFVLAFASDFKVEDCKYTV